MGAYSQVFFSPCSGITRNQRRTASTLVMHRVIGVFHRLAAQYGPAPALQTRCSGPASLQ